MLAAPVLDKRTIAEELMDDPALDAGTYTRVLHDLSGVNTLTLARRPTLAFLARAFAGRRSFKLLDVGFGDGDMLRTIHRWAVKRGIDAELTGVDLNPRSVIAAREATPVSMGIDFRTGDYAGLAAEGWDFVISSLVAHHMTRAELVAFLRFMERESAAGWLVNDLHRHSFAYAGWPLLAALMRWHPIVRHDGRLSIARSYRPAEWLSLLREAGIEDARVFRQFPFRLCVERLR